MFAKKNGKWKIESRYSLKIPIDSEIHSYNYQKKRNFDEVGKSVGFFFFDDKKKIIKSFSKDGNTMTINKFK